MTSTVDHQRQQTGPAGHPPRAVRGSALAGLSGLVRQLGPVALGLVVLGLGSFGFLSIAGRSLGPVSFAPVATLWVIFNAVALAFYQPIEQELSRETARRLALGTGAGPVLRRCVLAGVTLTALVGLVAIAGRHALGDGVFNGRTALVPLLLIGMVGLLLEHVMRGLFGGNQRLGRYGLQLATDGILRVAAPAALVVVSTGTTTSVAAVLVACPVVAALVTAGRPRTLAPAGPPMPWKDLLPALGTLTGAAVLSQLVVNAAPVAVQLLARADEVDRAGVFIAALVMTRIPLFFFGAVQAAFLPALARLRARGDRAGFMAQTRSVVLLAGGVGVVFVAALAVAGPFGLQVLYGPKFLIGRSVLVLLGLGAAAYMLAQALAQALIALQAYRGALAGWAVGSAVFLAGLALPSGLEVRVATALLAGGGCAALVMALFLVRAVATIPAPTADAASAVQG